MKDKVIKNSDGTRLYVLDELDYKNKKYIMGTLVSETDEVIPNSVKILEVLKEEDNTYTKEIEDFEIASVVNNMFLVRTQL